MVTSFSTPKVSTSTSSNSGKSILNTILILAVVGVGGYLVYRYAIKPKMDAKKPQQDGNQ